jgi:hypothetical protein
MAGFILLWIGFCLTLRGTDVLIAAIEDGIRSAAVCLADITNDNPNVWFELGFSFAADWPVVMVCSDERTGKYPFDIQHRTVTRYKTEAQIDFKKLSDELSSACEGLAERTQTLQGISLMKCHLMRRGSASPQPRVLLWGKPEIASPDPA